MDVYYDLTRETNTKRNGEEERADRIKIAPDSLVELVMKSVQANDDALWERVVSHNDNHPPDDVDEFMEAVFELDEGDRRTIKSLQDSVRATLAQEILDQSDDIAVAKTTVGAMPQAASVTYIVGASNEEQPGCEDCDLVAVYLFPSQ